MSFGTGHHETTQLMIEYLLEKNLKNKRICDVGCGTGILSIISEKRGAKLVDAIDININCYHNTLENIKRNKVNSKNKIYSSTNLIVDFSSKYKSIISEIRSFLRISMYNNKKVLLNNNNGKKIIKKLFNKIQKKPNLFISHLSNKSDKQRAVADFISGMTDRFAISLYNKIK